MVGAVASGRDQLGDRYDPIALGADRFDQLRQRIGGIFCAVVQEYDRPGTELLFDAVDDLLCGWVLPVKAVHVRHNGKLI